SSRDPLTRYQYLVVAEIHERSDDGLISRAAPLNPRLFETHLKQLVTRELLSEFDTAKGRQTANRITRIGAIELKREQTNDLSPQEAQQALINFLRSEEGMSRLPLLDSHRELQARAAWARDIAPERDIADISASKLRETEPFWLLPFIPKDARLSGISSQDITNALEARLTWVGKRELDSVAPDTFQLPSGKSRAISYSRFGEPVLEVVIQEIFGLSETPLIGTRKKPLTLHLLSPARRPMQVTKDLANFWRAIYPEVRKELRGRYPKHKWPEDPRQ
ncbi:MAG: ATP-dependent helicase C-terminal domain-containing protein, partial [Pseudomonadota bacterium]